MRRIILLTAAFALVLSTVPAGAEEEAACDVGAHERLTSEGWSLDFAPPFAIPDPAAVRDATSNAFTSYRNAVFSFVADFPEAGTAATEFLLEWGDATSDFDLHILDDEGWPLATSEDENLDGDPVERVTLTLAHCEQITVVVRNYLGSPEETLSLTITPDTGEDDADPAEDTRAFLYLAGDRPGQVAMAHGAPNNLPIPLTSGFSEERPSSGMPNSYSRPAVGFNDQRNLFQAHFTEWEMERDIVGDAAALVWVSSRTMADHDGTLYVQLYVDGAKVGELEVAGAQVGTNPTPIHAVFEDLDLIDAWDVTLQVSAEPIAASSGATSPPGNAHFTVHYDSVQFPSRLVLP